jgi:asparagine synthase (glutamine-hydrolysing)
MCGITGVYGFDPDFPIDRALFLRQTNAIAHRGPDDSGIFIDRGVAIGHRRLSIIDLGGGHQPMWDEENRIGVVFNGEIYNYRELMKTLEATGHRFKTASDTEVIIHGYREWGDRCVERFRGMFAFAILDTKARTMFLARDRLGKKPLYYYRDDDRIVFASELKAILEDPTVPRVLEPNAVADYFAYNYVPGPGTILAHIRKLPAGCTLYLSGRKATERKYWDLDFSNVDHTMRLDDAADRILATLEEAVRLRLRADVPLGAFLSGGIDSSLVVALMAKQIHRPDLEPTGTQTRRVKTHTIGFQEDGYDERRFARETSELYRTDHFEKMVAVDETGIVDRLSWFFDEPFGDSSAVPTYYLSQATREKVTVALSGDGGDESFAGYRRYVFAMFEDEVRKRLPGFLRARVVRPLARLYPKADYLPRYLRAKATLTNVAESHERAYFLSLTQKTYRRFLSKDFLAGLRGYDPYVHFEHHLANAKGADPLARLQYVDFKMYLCDDILVKVDRASMAHALEVRVPILDHELVELAARIPSNLKLSGRSTKRALRRGAEKLLGRSILDRKKMGFTIPLPAWFRGGLRARAESVFFDEARLGSGLVDTKGLKKMWLEHQRGIGDHATVLWSLLMFELWARRFLAPAKPLSASPEPELRSSAPSILR